MIRGRRTFLQDDEVGVDDIPWRGSKVPYLDELGLVGGVLLRPFTSAVHQEDEGYSASPRLPSPGL